MSAKKRKGGLALDAICAKLKTQRLQVEDSPEEAASPEDATDVAPQVSEEDVHVNGVASPDPLVDQDTCQNDNNEESNSRTDDSLDHRQSSLDSQQDCAMQDSKDDNLPLGNDSVPELASPSDDVALPQDEQPEDLSVTNDQKLDLANDKNEQRPEESSRRKRTPNKITHFQMEEELSDDGIDGDVVIVQPTGCSDSEDEIDETTEFENPFNQSDNEDQDDEDYDPEKDNINKRASTTARPEPQVASPVVNTSHKATAESKPEQTPPSEPHVSQGDASTLRDYAESTMNELIGMFGYDSSDHDLKALPLQTFSSGKILEMQIKERQGNGLQNEALALVQGLTGATIDGRGSKYDFFIQKLKSGENFADPNDTITAGTISPRRSSKFDPERIKYLQPQDISPILANLNEPLKKGGQPLKYDVRNFQGFNANASPQTVTTTMTTSDLQHSNNNSGDADLFDGELARTANASTDYIKACFSENGKPDVEEMLRNNEMNIFQKYIAKFSANVHCGHLHCMYQYKEHFHCLDTECNYQRFTNKQDVIRHYNMHKKKDNSLQHGFMRFSPLDDCSVYYSGCSLNLKHTHYHCMQVGCNKVYTSTSDVMTHENFHKKNAAFISEGFQRFRATEDCGIITCSFYGQKTTHFHCRRPNCNFSFKNKCDIEKHKAYHVKDDMYTKEGFKKFYKYEECRFDGCVYSKASNHFHCIRPGCGFTFTSTGQMHSHRRKHERRELRNLRDNKYTPGVHRMKLNQLIQQQQQLQLLQQQQQQQLQQQTLPIQIQVPQAAPAPVSLPPPTPLITTTAATDPSPAALQAAKLAKMPEATDVQEAKSGPVISASLARMAAAALSPSSKLAAASPTPSNSLPQFTVPNEDVLGQVSIKKEKESEEDECESSGGSLKLHIKQEDTSSQLMSMDGVDLSDSLNLTANFATLANPRASAAPEMDLGSSLNLNLPGVEEGDNARSSDTWEKFLKRYTANDPCDPRCEFLYKDHYHCVVEGCGAIFRSKEGVNKHAKYHRLSEGMIQNGFERFSQSQDCQKYDPNCQLRLKESHYHCTWPGCTHAVQMLTPNNQHYEQHKMMITPPSEIKPVPGSSLSSLPSGSQVDGIPGMRRFTLQENCGYPECYYSMKSSHYHCTKDGCLLAYVQAHAAANHPNMHDNSNSPISEHSLTPSPEGLQFFNKYHNAKDFFCYYGIKRLCPDQQCEYRLRGHYHCNKPGCHFTTVGTSKLPWHLKKHDKAEQREAQGYKFFTKRESCGRLGCKYSLKSSHFHCIRPGCKFNFQFKHQMVTHSRKHMRRLFGRNFEQVLKANGEAAMESVISNTPPGQPPQNAVSSLILKKPLLQSSASSSAATPVPILPMTSLPQTILLSPPANPMQVALTSPPHVLTTGAAAQMAFPVNLTVNTPNITQAAAASPTISTQAGEAIPMASTPLAIPQLAIISQAPSLAGTSLPTLMVTQPTTTLAGLGQPQLLSQVQQTQQMQVAHALQLAQQIQKAGLVTPTLLAQQVQTVAQPTLTSPNSMSPSPLFSSFSVPLTPLDSESSQPPSAPNTPGGSNDSTSNDSGTLHQLPTNRNPFSSFEFRVKKRRSRMIDDGTMLEGFARYDLYEDCKDPKCQFSMRVTHYHCTRPNCGYKFCGRTHMYKHSQHHDRVDSLVLDDFQRYKSSVSCGRDSCLFSEKSTHFHCLRCDFQCTDSTKVTAHRKHHSKSDTVQAAGFRQFGSGVSCEQDGCRYNMKCSHFHCMHDGCRHVVVGMSQMESHKRKHTKHSLSMAVPATV